MLRRYFQTVMLSKRDLLEKSNVFIPKMNQEKDDKRKGNCGYLAVIGGSEEYTGAPYFAAMTGLRVGCDLSHIICPSKASFVIKSFSPDLIVHPWLDSSNCQEQFLDWIDRFNAILIGPGIGRLESTEKTFFELVDLINKQNKPLIIDADGLFFVAKYPEKFRNFSSDLILTPNAIEFSRIAQSILKEPVQPQILPDENLLNSVQSWFGENSVIFHKGQNDYICGTQLLKGEELGSPRRCGGQGDLLAGAIGTFIIWATQSKQEVEGQYICKKLLACYCASTLIRRCSNLAYQIHGRGMITSDMLNIIPKAFEELFTVK